jgi:Flp pilus assembly protein CpaB
VEFAQKLTSTRRGTLLVGVTAAAVALVVVLVYLNRYRESLRAANGDVAVLVAKTKIQAGAPGDADVSGHPFRLTPVPRSAVLSQALISSSALLGSVATHDIYPPQLLSAADFAPAAPGALQSNLTGSQRAIALSIDAAHGMLGSIAAGDHVDVYVGFDLQSLRGSRPVVKQLASDVLVLRAPVGVASGNIVLRASGREAAVLAFAADNGQLWLVLRPASGAKPLNPGTIDSDSLLALKPVR